MNATSGGSPPLIERLRAGARSIELDGVTYWRVEGDLLLDAGQLEAYAREQERIEATLAEARRAGRPLVATAEIDSLHEGGRIVRWAPGLELTYCVLRRSFLTGGDRGYRLVVDCLRQACEDWEATCGVRFRHLTEHDHATDRPAEVLFTVREFDARGIVVAAAFFPNDPVDRRQVQVDPMFYALDETTFDRVGVMRHELGHVLGFRHEQISSGAPKGCPDEPTYGKIDLTLYDPRSVMHYFCAGGGTHELKITDLDREGAQRVYGPPWTSFRFVDR
jgi:hypothetical protein